MMALSDAIGEVQSIVGALSGIKGAPDNPPESINQFPFSLCYAYRGEWQRMSDWKKGLHTIVCEIHFSRQNLPKAIEMAMPYAESVPNALLGNPTLNGTVDTIYDQITYEFGFLPWGGQNDVHIGFRFEIKVKMQSGFS